MGILRLILAISVIIEHSSNIFGVGLLGGQVAVQSFYIISGFYMTLILKEKYTGVNGSYKLFITNRLLRLYPVYWTVLILTLIASAGFYVYSSGDSFGRLQPYSEYFSIMKPGSFLFLAISNVIILFQDSVMFLGLDNTSGWLYFTPNYRMTDPMLFNFLVIPQAWTVGLEISFYLIAPFLVKKPLRVLFMLIFLSIGLRVILCTNGLSYNPWSYRFFPTELLFFLLGIVAYHIYKKIAAVTISRKYLISIYSIILLFILSYSFVPFQSKSYIYLLFFFLSVPFVFLLSKDWKTDRYIGELSYPVYISHMLVVMIVEVVDMPYYGGKGLYVTILTLALSILLKEFIARKVEIYRQNRLK